MIEIAGINDIHRIVVYHEKVVATGLLLKISSPPSLRVRRIRIHLPYEAAWHALAFPIDSMARDRKASIMHEPALIRDGKRLGVRMECACGAPKKMVWIDIKNGFAAVGNAVAIAHSLTVTLSI